MADSPIVFSAPMIRALLEGRKTQTRRILKPQPSAHWKPLQDLIEIHRLDEYGEPVEPRFKCDVLGVGWCEEDGLSGYCAKWLPGDRLWVREAWTVKRNEPCEEHERDYQDLHSPTIRYAADGEEIRHQGNKAAGHIYHGPVETKKSAIHLPRWLSRLTLVVTGVKVERLQDISATDAEAEGVPTHVAEHTFAKVYRDPAEREATRVKYFRELWEKLYGADSWAANPWVAAITFRVVKANIAQIEASP